MTPYAPAARSMHSITMQSHGPCSQIPVHQYYNTEWDAPHYQVGLMPSDSVLRHCHCLYEGVAFMIYEREIPEAQALLLAQHRRLKAYRFTIDPTEYQRHIQSSHYVGKGVVGWVPEQGQPVFCVSHRSTHRYLYTTNHIERDFAIHIEGYDSDWTTVFNGVIENHPAIRSQEAPTSDNEKLRWSWRERAA